MDHKVIILGMLSTALLFCFVAMLYYGKKCSVLTDRERASRFPCRCGQPQQRKIATPNKGFWMVCQRCSHAWYTDNSSSHLKVRDLGLAEPEIAGPLPESHCCYLCEQQWIDSLPLGAERLGRHLFIVCQKCGNKRCPKATDHLLPCSGSNDPGQPGSLFR